MNPDLSIILINKPDQHDNISDVVVVIQKCS